MTRSRLGQRIPYSDQPAGCDCQQPRENFFLLSFYSVSTESKGAGDDADNSPSCSFEVKNVWRYTSILAHAFKWRTGTGTKTDRKVKTFLYVSFFFVCSWISYFWLAIHFSRPLYCSFHNNNSSQKQRKWSKTLRYVLCTLPKTVSFGNV